MKTQIFLAGVALAMSSHAGLAQRQVSVRAVAVIESIHADSAGRAIRRGQVVNAAVLDSLLSALRHNEGATIWFSWSGGPTQPRTVGQDRLLAQLQAAGIRVELRSDSTLFGRRVRP
jgi:hypothetical protein